MRTRLNLLFSGLITTRFKTCSFCFVGCSDLSYRSIKCIIQTSSSERKKHKLRTESTDPNREFAQKRMDKMSLSIVSYGFLSSLAEDQYKIMNLYKKHKSLI